MQKDIISQTRERINIRLYKHKNLMLNIIKALAFFVSILLLICVVFQFGFDSSHYGYHFIKNAINVGIALLLFRYILDLIYQFSPLKYILENRLEFIIIGILAFDQIFYLIFNQQIILAIIHLFGFKHAYLSPNLFQQITAIVLILFSFSKSDKIIRQVKIGPAGFLVFSFIIIILTGSVVLMLPEMTNIKISFIDSLFTATSASCVTGLTTIDVATSFSLKGKLVILALIQAGGLNIVMFVTFFALLFKEKSGVKASALIKDMISSDRISETRSLMRRILLYSFSIEIAGSIGLFFSIPYGIPFDSSFDKMFFALFHSVSAFNNAGISLLSNNLFDINMQMAYNFQLIICALIITGGIGFIVLQDIHKKSKLLFKRKFNRKPLNLHSEIVLKVTLTLLVGGTVLIFLIENHNSFEGLSLSEKLHAAFFQSVTSRSAGFNSVNIAALAPASLFVIIILMFIGSSPSSTGGGIKTTTTYVIFRATWSTIIGRNNVEVKKYSIDFDTIDKAYTVMLFAISLITISTFVLLISEPNMSFLALLFEEISAFGNVGLSVGITPNLSIVSKSVLIFTMYAGRIGIPTLALALVKRTTYRNYKYPYKKIIVG